MTKTLYHVLFDEDTKSEGRIFYKDTPYPVIEKDADYVTLLSENGEFNFSHDLMERLIEAWELKVVENE